MTRQLPFEEVLAAAKLGDEWAWEQIYRSVAGGLTGYLTLRGSPDPEDQVSETLLQVARNIATFDGDEKSFRSWVFVIAHRRMIDSRRAAGRRLVTTPLTDHGTPGGDVETEAIERLELGDVAELLAVLTDDQREVVVLRLLGDLSLAQTADVMGKAIGAVKALQRRAITNLREHLEQQGVSR